MKWTIQELKKLSRTSREFDGELDLSSYIQEDDDILNISPVKVTGTYQIIEDSEYIFDCHIETVITMPCAVTLEDVDVPLSFNTELTFAKTMQDDNTFLIEGITIDLDPIIYSEILIEKPMRVVSPGSEEFLSSSETLDEEEKESNNPFASLKNMKL